jgi:hypothetical protein
LRERHERQYAALAAVVGAHQENDVFCGHREKERIDEQRYCADDRSVAHEIGFGGVRERLTQRIEGARPNVAVNDADRPKDERRERAVAPGGSRRRRGGGACGGHRKQRLFAACGFGGTVVGHMRSCAELRDAYALFRSIPLIGSARF